MINLTNNPASIDKNIPAEKLFDPETIEQFEITEVKWLMTIKPGIRNVIPYIEGRVRMEEIEVFLLRIEAIPDKQSYYHLLSQLHRKVMYPCVVFLEYFGKYKVITWSFIDAVKKPTGVVLKSPYISAWIHEPATSEKAELFISKISELLLNGEGSIKDLYHQICTAILYCTPQFIGSRSHLLRILYDLTGKRNHPLAKKIDTQKYYKANNSYAKYQKKMYGDDYKYSYEYEDIWAAFMQDETIKMVITNRRYRDMEDLVFQIDSKEEEARCF